MKKLAASLLAVLILVTGLAGSVSANGQAAPDAPAATWQTIMSEGFEGTWPGGLWSVVDAYPDQYQRYWGKANYRAHAGSWSAWPAAGGAQAVTPGAGVVYPNDLSSQMIYGPFDLSDVFDAEVRFWMWLDVEAGFDYVSLYASHDGVSFNELQTWDGTTAGNWEEFVINLVTPPPGPPGYNGDPSVWLRVDFISDYSNGLEGPFIDDITLRKLPLAAPVVTIGRSGSSDIRLEWPANPDAAAYEVWRAANSPYFAPGADCAAAPSACSLVTTNYYVHSGGSGSTADNYTYVVRAVQGAVKSLPSNRTAEFDFTLVKGG